MAIHGNLITETLDELCPKIAKEYGTTPEEVSVDRCVVPLGYNRFLEIQDHGSYFLVQVRRDVDILAKAEFRRVTDTVYDCGKSREHKPGKTIKKTVCSIEDGRNSFIISKENTKVRVFLRAGERLFRADAKLEI